jgi:hypothetical protein
MVRFASKDFANDLLSPLRRLSAPDGLLECFAISYSIQAIRMCGQALDELFEFESAEDVADSLGLPPDRPWWGKTNDMQSTLNMFDACHVTVVELDWEACIHQFIDTSTAPPETTMIEGVCRMFEPDVRVYIEEPGEEPWIIWANSTLLDIMVRPDPDEPGVWTILRIKERYKYPVRAGQLRAGVSGTEGSSWGSIKAMFN